MIPGGRYTVVTRGGYVVIHVVPDAELLDRYNSFEGEGQKAPASGLRGFAVLLVKGRETKLPVGVYLGSIYVGENQDLATLVHELYHLAAWQELDEEGTAELLEALVRASMIEITRTNAASAAVQRFRKLSQLI